jgi:hypothetical protein
MKQEYPSVSRTLRILASFSLFLVLAIHESRFTTSRSFAATYLGVREFGDPVSGAGARSVAMGSTGISRGEDAAVFRLNPALGGDIDSKEISLTLGPVFLAEKVVVTSTSTKFRDNRHIQMNEFAAVLRTPGGRAWVGLSVAPTYDFNYDAAFTQFSSTGSPTAEVRVDDSGSLWTITPGVGVSLSDGFAMALSYDVWVGNEDIRVYQFRYGTGFTADFKEKADYSGGAPRVGLRWKASDNLRFGAIFQPSSRLTRDYEFVNSTHPAANASGKDKWDMPGQWGLGLSYRAGGDRDTEMTAEIRQTAWGSVEINGTDINSMTAAKPIMRETSENAGAVFGVASATPRRYRDVTEVLLGVEHELNDQWRLRLGFHHLPYFADRSVEATYFSAGAGYAASDRWGWALAGEFGKRDYKGDNLFFPAARRVDETFRRILLTGRFRW